VPQQCDARPMRHPERSEGSARMHSSEMFVYVLASRTKRLYVGVTNDLVRRVWEHRFGPYAGFTRKYSITKLVYFETFKYPGDAIRRKSRSRVGAGSSGSRSSRAQIPNGLTWRSAGLKVLRGPIPRSARDDSRG